MSDGLLAQLVERLNGIEEVNGSNPLGSTTHKHKALQSMGALPLPFEGGAVGDDVAAGDF